MEDELSLREGGEEFRDEAASRTAECGGIAVHEFLQGPHILVSHGHLRRLVVVCFVVACFEKRYEALVSWDLPDHCLIRS